MHSVVAVTVALSLLPLACSPGPAASPTPRGTVAPALALRYVALGDSYTIGTSVATDERWPNQLVERLRGTAELELVANLGVNGYTSADLITFELPQVGDLQPDLVSVLIGVNDVVRRVPEEEYRRNLALIFGTLLDEVPRERIVVVSTPDYTRTPRGADFGDRAAQRAQIVRFNEILAASAEERGIAFVDISSVADQAGDDPSLVARDLLHPSGVQYSRWVDLIAPVVAGLLTGESAP